MILKFLRVEDGVTAIEYALIAFLIAIAVIAGIMTVGKDVSFLYSKITSAISTVL